MLALLRIIDLRIGKITIDGIDCAEMGLSALRSNISVILQDHFLFAGTVQDVQSLYNIECRPFAQSFS